MHKRLIELWLRLQRFPLARIYTSTTSGILNQILQMMLQNTNIALPISPTFVFVVSETGTGLKESKYMEGGAPVQKF